ncbi:MAG: helix-turn-helix domain-containing protein [Desulfotomaculum sp.]|nr:helix-turn-helix domain-containing protein [Desulfotomaculum sp.]
MASFGERLAQLRKEKGLSQSRLASLLKLGQSTIAMYERNKREPDTATINKLADFFGVSVDYLLGRSSTREIDILDVLEDSSTQVKAGDKPLSPEQRLALLQNLNDDQKAIRDPEIQSFMNELNAFFRVDKNLTPEAKREIMEDLAEYFRFKIQQHKKKN